MDVNKSYKDLPTNVSTKEDLALLPTEFLSDDPKRPLQNIETNEDGKSTSTYKYALNPLWYSVVFILLIELLERFTYYGVVFTQTEYLLGGYDPNWNANMTAEQATSFVSGTTGLAYTAPFIGGILADALLGDYWGIVFGTTLFYLPGLILIALISYPYLLGDTYNMAALRAGMLALFPLGTGFIKSLVNIFGAKQYHPVLQTNAIESYYVNFYLSINIGALVGGILIPLLAQENITVAYTLPACVLGLGLICFLMGSRRYVRGKPRKLALFRTLKLLGGSAIRCRSLEKAKSSNGGELSDSFVDGVKNLLAVIPITALIIPFNVAYSQMTTVFILQGEAMQPVGKIDAVMMNNFDSVAVIIFGLLIGSGLYPYLAKRHIYIPITYKFAIGTVCGMFAILSAVIVDYQIHKHLEAGKPLVNVFWQIFSYLFIGAGEIFSVAAAYDAAFMIAPKEQKGLASSFNLFLIGAIPSFICVGLNKAMADWFPAGNVSSEEDYLVAYSQSKMYDFLWVLVGISLFGVVINVLPPVKNWVERVHESATATNLSAFLTEGDMSNVSEMQGEDGKEVDKTPESETDEVDVDTKETSEQ